jgi:hypothetical protein
MTGEGKKLGQLLQAEDGGGAQVAEFLDGLALAETIGAVRSLSGPGLQRLLWKAVGAGPRVSLADLVPADHPPMRPVVFHGKNSLPAFSEFQKICCRPPADRHENALWGYNETRIRPLIGPGYYIAHDTADAELGGAAFDYNEVPEGATADRPRGWPEPRPNDVGLSRFIYNGMVDYMRRVSRDVFIGSATKGGREIGSYFVVAREL